MASSTHGMNGAASTGSTTNNLRNMYSFSDPTPVTSIAASITTEGWLELFLTTSQKATFSKWLETINDKSITHKATNNFFNIMAVWIPDNVAPNVVTAAGFLSLGQAWYVANLYGAYFLLFESSYLNI